MKTATVEAAKQYLAVGAGGVLGALLRETLEVWIAPAHGFPLATLLINWSGSFFLAWFYTVTIWKWKLPQWFRAGVGTGIVGAYTTFSTFVVETDALFAKGRMSLAILYLFLSLVGGFAFALLGGRLSGGREKSSVMVPDSGVTQKPSRRLNEGESA